MKGKLRQIHATLKQKQTTSLNKSKRYAVPMPSSKFIYHTPTHYHLAVLSSLGIPNCESRDTILIHLRIRRIQESQRCIASHLRVHANNVGAMAVRNVICERDVGRKVGAGVESARAQAAVEG